MRRHFLAALAGIAIAAPLAQAQDARSQLMFVQLAESMRTEGDILRLVGLAPQTLWFTDRPQRLAGHITMPAFMEEWTNKAGADNFAKDPPNATLSVYEPGRSDNTLAVIEISHPVIEGRDLVYKMRVIDGKVPATGGATSIFIDWIGVGGGVGPGFHGVGAGARGVGYR
jgi:hypothetical protein